MRYVRVRLLALVLGMAFTCTVAGGSISTAQIMTRTTQAAFSCMQWMPVGICFWLRCSWSGCRVRSSLKVGHYNPDLVVAVYNELGANPWNEVRATLGLAQETAAEGLLGSLLGVTAGSGSNRTEGRARTHTNLIFREADAIGHPLTRLPVPVYTCGSQTRPFVPYFQSSLDALSWRHALPEMLYPASLVPGLREVGASPLQTWGSVYPRTGWLVQVSEPKAGAVIAQRAGDIVTRRYQPHVYVPLAGSSASGQRMWPPGALIERKPRTGQWQRLTPDAESGCDVFGDDDRDAVSSWGDGEADEGGDYAWTLWRPYQCCRRRGQWFLYHVNWMAYPP
ncbi:MAG: TIGR03756 family integrating conjugative element protein [Gammaproteobacteria bacterium]|nr:TIGR03756 family integrating conjugative element protein [Gammaproteobacteria bacterium]